MKKLFGICLITMFLLVGFTGAAFAARGGMPEAHGVDGRTFGEAVSEKAQEYPGAVADHVTGCCPEAEDEAEAKGMPAAHGVDGRTFGELVSALAQEDPGELADHVSANAQGIPALHGMSGYEFGQAVRSNAPISDHLKR